VSHMTQSSQSQLDETFVRAFIEQMIATGETNAGIVSNLRSSKYRISTTKDSIRRFRKRHSLLPPPAQGRPGIRYDGDEADVTGYPKIGLHMDDPDTMLEERGLDPEEWLIDGATVNEWDGPSQEGPVTYHQAKFHIKRKRPELQLLAARSDGWVAPPRKRATTKGTQLIVVAGDHQAPFHNEGLHDQFIGWLEDNQPDELVALGDKIDLPNVSRHRLDPENTAKVNECIQSGYDLFRDYRNAAPNTIMKFMPGNHDLRIRDLILDKPSMHPLHGVKQADILGEEGEPVLGLPHLLRLDELGIEYVDPHGPYELAQVNLSDKLAVRHGWIVRQGSGSSALSTLEHLGYSCITGHTHRQSMVYKTKHEIDGKPRQIVGVEAGCMCRVDQTLIKGRKWPDFVTSPDWQPGFATVEMWNDGGFKVDLATYVNDTLYYRDKRYA
jgi:hypothetical protein